MTGYFDDLA